MPFALLRHSAPEDIDNLSLVAWVGPGFSRKPPLHLVHPITLNGIDSAVLISDVVSLCLHPIFKGHTIVYMTGRKNRDKRGQMMTSVWP